ncbi:MAG: peptidylprolyl isomerase [Planctomycetales bacterium]|nr:peptidylprolyl isomerase [Planctomycetales bacterium]
MARQSTWLRPARPSNAVHRHWGYFLIITLLASPLAAWGQASAQPQARPTNRAASRQPTTARSTAPKSNDTVPVAVVNSEKISRRELANECLRRFGTTILESEVNKYLIRQACRDRQVQITEQEVDAEVERVAAGLRLTVDKFYGVIEDERNIDRQQYRRDIVWPMLALRRLAAGQLEVSQEEIAKAYETEFGPRVQVRMIAVSDVNKAKQIHVRLSQNPSDFERLAKEHSEDPNSAAASGMIPPVRRYVGDPVVEKTVFALKPDEVSPIVHVADQYLIFRCDRHIPATRVSVEEKGRVAEDLKQRISDVKLRDAASQLFQQLQADAKVVNVMNDAELRKQMPGVAATINGGQITLADLGEQCVVRHGLDVLEGEINRKLLEQALRRRSLQVTKADIDEEIQRAAESFGFANDQGQVDVKAWLDKVTTEGEITVDIYVRDVVWPSVALKKLVTSEVTITEEDLQRSFQANYGERVNVLAIVMNDQRTAHKVFDLARNNDTEKFFGELAHQYSVEPVSRANYGQVPPIRKFGGEPVLEKEAFQLKPGEHSGVVALGDKFIVLRCLGRTKPVVQNMNAVRDELVKDIREKKVRLAMTDEFDRLKENAQIDNFLAKTSHVPKSQVQQVSHSTPAAGRNPATPRTNSPAKAPAKAGAAAGRATRRNTTQRK